MKVLKVLIIIVLTPAIIPVKTNHPGVVVQAHGPICAAMKKCRSISFLLQQPGNAGKTITGITRLDKGIIHQGWDARKDGRDSHHRAFLIRECLEKETLRDQGIKNRGKPSVSSFIQMPVQRSNMLTGKAFHNDNQYIVWRKTTFDSLMQRRIDLVKLRLRIIVIFHLQAGMEPGSGN